MSYPLIINGVCYGMVTPKQEHENIETCEEKIKQIMEIVSNEQINFANIIDKSQNIV